MRLPTSRASFSRRSLVLSVFLMSSSLMGVQSFTAPSFARSSACGPLSVSVGLGPGETDEETEEKKELVAGVDYEIPDHEAYRLSRRSLADERADRWFGDLLNSHADEGCLGSIVKDMREALETPVELVNDIERPEDDELWTPYVQTRLPWTPLTPAYGLEEWGIPVPRRNAETWRHFDVNGMISQAYNGTPPVANEAPADFQEWREKLRKVGGWLDDDMCDGRLVYVDGIYVPELSKATDVVQNHNGIDDLDATSVKRLGRLTDGFTDELAAPVPNNDEEETSFSMLSRPNHNLGAATTQFAINTQQGTACFAAINSIKTKHVAHIKAPAGTNADLPKGETGLPIMIINAITPSGGCTTRNPGEGVAVHPRTLVEVEDDARINLVQACVDLGTVDNDEDAAAYVPRLYNGYTQFFVGAKANVTHTYLEETGGRVVGGVEMTDDEAAKANGADAPTPRSIEAKRPQLQNTHLEALDVHITGDGGNYQSAIINLGGGGRVRISQSVALLRPGAHAGMFGFGLSAGAQRTDVKTSIHHIAQGTTSEQLQKNMIGGRATGSFRGRIRVEQSAQQTDSQQLSRTILLSDRCRAWAVPSLEIIADDITCTHGATVSDLSEEELFYLRSRGLDQLSARNMLMYAYSDEVTTSQGIVPDSLLGGADGSTGLRRRILQRLENVVPQGERALAAEFQSI